MENIFLVGPEAHKEFRDIYLVKRSSRKATSPNNFLKGLEDLCKENITDNMIVAEIGSFAGVSTWMLAQHCKKVFSVDILHGTDEFLEKVGMPVAVDGDNWCLATCRHSYEFMLKENSNVDKIVGLSVDVAKKSRGMSLDGVYIDGDHEYESVKADLEAWEKLVKPGGFIAGHDWEDANIMKAVEELMTDLDLDFADVKVYDDTSWVFFTKKAPKKPVKRKPRKRL